MKKQRKTPVSDIAIYVMAILLIFLMLLMYCKIYFDNNGATQHLYSNNTEKTISSNEIMNTNSPTTAISSNKFILDEIIDTNSKRLSLSTNKTKSIYLHKNKETLFLKNDIKLIIFERIKNETILKQNLLSQLSNSKDYIITYKEIDNAFICEIINSSSDFPYYIFYQYEIENNELHSICIEVDINKIKNNKNDFIVLEQLNENFENFQFNLVL